MPTTTEHLDQPEERVITIPGIGEKLVAGTRHHWLALEECQQNGWQVDRIVELAWRDADAQALDFGFTLLGLIAYIQADGRATLGAPEESGVLLPQLPTSFPAGGP